MIVWNSSRVITSSMVDGREVRGVIQCDSVPKQFIPQLADHIAKGRFPIERRISYYELKDINRAADDSANGKAIKPVLRLPHSA